LFPLSFFSLRPFNVSCVLRGGGGKGEERWSPENFAAGDGSRQLADRHSPLEVFFKKIVDSSPGGEPAIPIADKTEYRPEGDHARIDCRNPIHGLLASRHCQGKMSIGDFSAGICPRARLFVSKSSESPARPGAQQAAQDSARTMPLVARGAQSAAADGEEVEDDQQCPARQWTSGESISAG
jgi:hypothetical protein